MATTKRWGKEARCAKPSNNPIQEMPALVRFHLLDPELHSALLVV
jgi:hypothetical protein